MTTPQAYIARELHKGMHKGNMHGCLLDFGRLAGGYQAAGDLSTSDVETLGNLAESLSTNKAEGRGKWEAAIAYGQKQPVTWEAVRPDHENRAYDWDEKVVLDSTDKDFRIVDASWIEDEDLPEPGPEWNPTQDLIKYLETLFDADDYVGYVTQSWEKDGKHLPQRGCFDRTAGQLIDLLGKYKGDIEKVFGTCKPTVGAWIRFNALDGKGVKDANIMAYRHALVESDEMSIGKQAALYRELELPIAALVFSGGKSVHAIVKIEADTMEEYRKRVDFLYEVCADNGLTVDRQNRNPSRLSRMPGVTRDGRKQWLIATNIGKLSWKAWEEWIIAENDDLPDIEAMEITDKEPPLAPELIQGILREGHKMMLSGPSKAAKTFALMQLAVAIAEGGNWLGWLVTQGRVLYVNLELCNLSCPHRFWVIYKTLGLTQTPGTIDAWNLRGSATSLDKLAPKLIRRAQKKKYKAIIIDPIYKVLTGDENSAEQMAHFCNQFDKICAQLGAATIVCHHHSKGAQGQKQSQDRSSGSGVFSRDPDAIIDLIELDIDRDRRAQIINTFECGSMGHHLNSASPGWAGEMGHDDALVAEKVFQWAVAKGLGDMIRPVRAEARKIADHTTGWRVEATLREFFTPKPFTIYFRYPIHLVDDSGVLTDAKAAGEEPPWKKNQATKEEKAERRREVAKEKKTERVEQVEAAIGSKFGKPVTIAEVAEYMACTEKTARKHIGAHAGYTVKKGVVVAIDETENQKGQNDD